MMISIVMLLVGYAIGILYSIIAFKPMKNWQMGYDTAKETYDNWEKGFNTGFQAAANHFKEYKLGFMDGWKAKEREEHEVRD